MEKTVFNAKTTGSIKKFMGLIKKFYVDIPDLERCGF